MNRFCLFIGIVIGLGWFGDAKAGEPVSASSMKNGKLPLPCNLETLHPVTREALAKVMQSPTLTAICQAEEFCASSDTYLWLLDHPDRVSLAWRRLNIGAVDICPLDGGRFVWKDENGSELTWRTVSKNGDGRIWYAEGKVRPGALLPVVPVRAVAVLRHGARKKEDDGDPIIRHQLEVFLQTDSRAANVVLRMIGPTAPRMAEQGAEQLLLFFSGIARYLEKHPTKAEVLLNEKGR